VPGSRSVRVGSVLGIGLDLVELTEFASSVANRKTVARRVFTPGELAYCEDSPRRIERLAARFAAKEATLKAVGTGWAKGVTWRDVEVVAQRGAAPMLVVRREVLRHARELGGSRFHVSLTHTGSYAAAIVLLVAD